MSEIKILDLSIIIVSYNTSDLLVACLDSIYKNIAELSYEIIVVDNSSSDGSADALKKLSKNHKTLKLIKSETNLGFGKANNLAARQAKGKYLLFLNSDTVIKNNLFPYYIDQFRRNDSLGAISCKLVNQDGTYQPSGGYFPILSRLIIWQLFIDDLPILSSRIKSYHPSKVINSATRFDWITGAFFMVDQYTFNEVAGFDEQIFMYTEEMELCYRMKMLGREIILDPTHQIIHLGKASSGSYLALTEEVKNIYYFFHKHMPAWQLPIVRLTITLGSLLRYLIFGIIKNNVQSRKVYGKILRTRS